MFFGMCCIMSGLVFVCLCRRSLVLSLLLYVVKRWSWVLIGGCVLLCVVSFFLLREWCEFF